VALNEQNLKAHTQCCSCATPESTARLPTPHNHPPAIVRLLCGEPLYDVDLSDVTDAGDARITIAASLGIHPDQVQLVDMASHRVFDDTTPFTGEVQVVRLDTNPVAEHDAEAAFIAAAQVGCMADLSDREALIRVKRSGLLALPDNLRELGSLQCLDLRGNELTHLPESIGELTSLKSLDVSKNKLRALPTSFGQMKALRFLHMHMNQLGALPESFGHLASLQNLYLGRNQLTKLPDTFGLLSALRKLYLKGNKLKKLPDALQQLLTLEVLDL